MSNQVYGYITDKIMEELERGCVPWHKPWKITRWCAGAHELRQQEAL